MRITTLNVPADLQAKYNRIMSTLERFYFPRLGRKHRMISRARRLQLENVTYMFYAAELWRAKSFADKQAWKSAGDKSGINGWQYYLQDKSFRLMNDIPEDAIPSDYHQTKVGHIEIRSPANEILITQKHPYVWWEWYKKSGRRKMYSKQKVTERLTFPFKIGISRKTKLTADGALPYCYLIARITHFHNGLLFYTDYPIEMPLDDDWDYQEIEISAPGGYVGTYELQLRLNDVVGEIWFDNIIAEHVGTNFARDPYCNDITREFFDEWFNVAMNWEPTNVPAGAMYESVYPGIIVRIVEATEDDACERIDPGPPESQVYYNQTRADFYLGVWEFISGRGGFRFRRINIPQGATILSAKVTFRSEIEYGDAYPEIEIRGIDEDNTPVFSEENAPFDRAQTTAQVDWVLSGETEWMERDSPDLKDLVQEIVDRPGWSYGNALAFYFKGLIVGALDNRLQVHSFDYQRKFSPRLIIAFRQ